MSAFSSYNKVWVREQCARSLTRLQVDSNIFDDGRSAGRLRKSSVKIGGNAVSCTYNHDQHVDIEKGEILGTGGFSNIQAIATTRRGSLFAVAGGYIETTDTLGAPIALKAQQEKKTVQQLDLSSFSSKSNRPLEKYAVKSIRGSIDDRKKYNGTIDLAKEAKFLSVLSHKHIIGFHSEADNVGTLDYFIIIERLQICLPKQFKLWNDRRVSLQYSGESTKVIAEGSQRLMDKRLVVMFQVSSGVAYIHQKNIMFRDLKPDNVGLTSEGQAKIFDFGLAKELKMQDKVGADQYRATQMCGTRRYMPQEVFYGKPYGIPVDVYSFSLMLWEVASLDIPYEGMTAQEHVWSAYRLKIRPRIKMKWPKLLKRWIKKGWSHKPQARLKMASISNEMHQYLTAKGLQVE